MEKESLTERQKDIYAIVAGYITDNNYSPTYQEIAERSGMSVQMVDAYLHNIAKKGWIRFTSKKWRNVELIPK